ncbi:unnamed protein product, partial [Staurois parvus]
IHYIWSPTVHTTWKCNYFSKYKLLNTFSRQLLEQSSEHCRSFLSALGGCRTPDLCLDSADWPCADHMHSPKKKKTFLVKSTKLSMCSVSPHDMSYQDIRGGHWKKSRIREVSIKQHFYTMRRINPLGSTVSITSMLNCIYKLILLLWV